MHGVGPGSLLGGRYLVQRRVSQQARYERWSAADQTLERDVVLLCFEKASPVASAVMDAARRAAGVEEPRLVRVLDVYRGADEQLAFVVEEPVPRAQSLSWILGEGGLPAEEVRRIVGEAASALETARARGLHHLVLTPRSVLRMDDGSIKVRGLATEAALAEADDVDSKAATRADTVALVALGYAGLTSRWPLDGPGFPDSGLQAAPRVVDAVAAPSELAAGVPGDLDLLIRRTLTEDTGPQTPAELVDDIAPWSPTPLVQPVGPIGMPGGPGGASASGGAAGGPAQPAPGGSGSRTEPLQREPASRGAARTAAAASAVRVSTLVDRRPQAGSGDGSGEAGDDGSGATGPGTAAALATGAAGVTKSVGRGVGTAAVAAGGLAAAVGGKVSSAVRSAADRAAEKSAERAERRYAEQADPYEDYDGDGGYSGEQGHLRLSDTLEVTEDELEPPVPPIAGAPPMERLDGEQSRLALLIVGIFVLLAAVLGVWGLPKLSGISDVAGDAPVVTRTVTGTATATAAPPAGTTPPAAAAAPVAIAGASQYDPENGGVQASKTAVLAFDGNPQTMWRSSKWYATPDFGGFQKQGLGLMLDLGKATDVRKVAFSTRGAADVTVYVGAQPQVKGATPIGSVAGVNGDATVAVPGNGVVKGQYVFVFFTKLGPDGEGRYRAQIAEVKVS